MAKAFTEAKTLKIAAYAHEHGYAATRQKFNCVDSTIARCKKIAAGELPRRTGARTRASGRLSEAQRIEIGRYALEHSPAETIQKFGVSYPTATRCKKFVADMEDIGATKRPRKGASSKPSPARAGQGDIDLPGLKRTMLDAADRMQAKVDAVRAAAEEL